MTLEKVYLPKSPPQIIGTPCRLAPTAKATFSGYLAKSGQVVPASITSIISVLVEEDNGHPEVIMTLESVDKKKTQINDSFSSNLFLYKISSVTSTIHCLFRRVISDYSGILFYHFLHNRILAFGIQSKGAFAIVINFLDVNLDV